MKKRVPTPAFLLTLSLLALSGCASAAPEASSTMTPPANPSNATAQEAITPGTYLFRVAEGTPTATAQDKLNELLRPYDHAPATLVGQAYLRVAFSQDPGLSTLQTALKGQKTLIAVQPDYRYGTHPPRRTP